MPGQLDISNTVVENARPTPQASGATLHWDDSSHMCGEKELYTLPADRRRPSFQAKGAPVTAYRAVPYWTTEQISRVPPLAPQPIAWEKEASLMTFALPADLLVATETVFPGATCKLVWFSWRAQTAFPTHAVHPALLVYAPDTSPRQAERVTIVPSLHANDPLLHHMALLLQTTVAAEGVAEQLYASVLANALVVHFLRRYTASRPPLRQANGGLAPAKLRRTLAYIEDHLEQTLTLATLAAVAQISPAHFARLFKQATGHTPHQYVITCRMVYAKRLLVDTDMPLGEIALQVGCADQSHFTALFRKHVSMTPLVYRNTTQL